MQLGVQPIIDPLMRDSVAGDTAPYRGAEMMPQANSWQLTPAANDLLYPVRRILDVNVAVLQQHDAVALVQQAVARQHGSMFTFCNAHTANMARTDGALRAALAQATVFNDGIGVDLASEMLYRVPFPDNLNGTDLTPLLLASLPAGTPVFLVGSAPGVAEKAGTLLARDHGVTIAGTHHGFFTEADEPALLAAIAASGARLVIAAMGNPRQEVWAARHCQQLGRPILCVGAFLDFTAGVFNRAPASVRRLRLEWSWRLLLEPQRLARRYLIGNAAFLLAIRQQRHALRAEERRQAAVPA